MILLTLNCAMGMDLICVFVVLVRVTVGPVATDLGTQTLAVRLSAFVFIVSVVMKPDAAGL